VQLKTASGEIIAETHSLIFQKAVSIVTNKEEKRDEHAVARDNGSSDFLRELRARPKQFPGHVTKLKRKFKHDWLKYAMRRDL
jgi:hypothetical protein